MRNALLLFLCLFSAATVLRAQTPVCKRDSNILKTGAFLSPAPYTPDSPFINLKPACIGKAYSENITVNIPTTYLSFPLTSASIATAGAVNNLPAGLSYKCDPPNCVFPAGTLGCFLVSGTPDPSNATGYRDLGIKANIFTALAPGVPIAVEFPGTVAPGAHYYMEMRNAACTPIPFVGTGDLSEHVADMRNAPNPFSGQTTILVEAKQGGAYTFEVFTLLGKRVYAEKIRLESGHNRFDFNADQLASGAYFYSVGNAEGRMTKLMTIQR